MRPSNPHDASLPRDPEAVNSERLATILSRSGLFVVTGEPVRAPIQSAPAARIAFEATLTEEQRTLYLDACDAQSDAGSIREEAAERLAHARGLIVGLALRSSPDYPSALVAGFGSALANVLLTSKLPADDMLWTAIGIVNHLLEIVQPGALHRPLESEEDGEPEVFHGG